MSGVFEYPEEVVYARAAEAERTRSALAAAQQKLDAIRELRIEWLTRLPVVFAADILAILDGEGQP